MYMDGYAWMPLKGGVDRCQAHGGRGSQRGEGGGGAGGVRVHPLHSTRFFRSYIYDCLIIEYLVHNRGRSVVHSARLFILLCGQEVEPLHWGMHGDGMRAVCTVSWSLGGEREIRLDV